MSLNKIPPLPNGENVGYDLKLNVGCDTLKCNNAIVENELTINGSIVNPTNFERITANYTTTNGASISSPTQTICAFRSGNYLRLCDNVTVTTDNTATFTTFNIEFDLPSYVPVTGVTRCMTQGSGGRDGVVYTVLKVNSTYTQGSGRLSLTFIKDNNGTFNSTDQIDCQWDVTLDLGE